MKKSLSIILVCWVSCLVAAPKLVTYPSGQAPKPAIAEKMKAEQAIETSHLKKTFDRHAVVFSGLARHPYWKPMTWVFSREDMINILPEKMQHIACDFGVEYHYRPMKALSVGFSLERLQIPTMPIDLRFLERPMPLDLTTLERIADHWTDLVDYIPEHMFLRSYSYMVQLRAYFHPGMTIDPFFQFGIGLAHHRARIGRIGGSTYWSTNDVPWTWTIGLGAAYALSDHFSLESIVGIRHERKMAYKDQVINSDTLYELIGLTDQSNAFELKLSITRSW